MVVTNYAKEKINLFIGGSQTAEFPTFFMIGSGSGVAVASDTTLQYAVDRQEFTATSFPAGQKTTWQGDWNVSEMSGIQLQQFGAIGSALGTTGSQWSINSLAGLNFDGTNELRIEETWEVY